MKLGINVGSVKTLKSAGCSVSTHVDCIRCDVTRILWLELVHLCHFDGSDLELCVSRHGKGFGIIYED